MLVERWRKLAYTCRYANQDVFRLLGRDPVTEPLSPVEERLFLAGLKWCLDAEFKKPDDAAEG